MILDVLKRINLEEPITTHFRWKEALYLRQWNFYAYPSDEQKFHIFNMALKLEDIRELTGGRDISATSWLRPEPYNKLIGGSLNSQHILGKAVDINICGLESEVVQKFLLDHLDRLGLSMELDTQGWTHLQFRKPGGPATFLP
jgi:hypothetical protein